MRILHLGKYYPPHRGGMETALRHLAEGLVERDCTVSVLVAGDGPLDRVEVLSADGEHPPGRLVRAAVHGHVNSQPLTLTLLSTLRRELALLQPDLVHLHLPNPLAAGAWCALASLQPRALPPLLLWHHADLHRQRLGRYLVEPVVRCCRRRAVGISVSSQTLADGSRELAPVRQKVRVIPFGIPPRPWVDLEPSRRGPFLFVGRLVAYKGLEVLLAAVARVPEARLVIVGDGPLAGRLRSRAAAPDLAGRVLLAGELDGDELRAHLAAARALVLPSLDGSETFGLAQLEAMAAGVPVVASRLATGVAEVGREGETTLLVPPGDTSALADVLARLLADDGLTDRLGAGGRSRYLEHFTRSRMVEGLLQWYGERLAAVRDAGG